MAKSKKPPKPKKLSIPITHLETLVDLAALVILATETHFNKERAVRDAVLLTVNDMLDKGIELPIPVAEKLNALRFSISARIGSRLTTH